MTNKEKSFLDKFPFGKVPAFEGADGLLLSESNAISYYGQFSFLSSLFSLLFLFFFLLPSSTSLSSFFFYFYWWLVLVFLLLMMTNLFQCYPCLITICAVNYWPEATKKTPNSHLLLLLLLLFPSPFIAFRLNSPFSFFFLLSSLSCCLQEGHHPLRQRSR